MLMRSNFKLFGQSVLLLTAGLLFAGSAVAQESNVDQQSIDKHFVIGGQPTSSTAYPWTVALTYNTQHDLFQRQFCGGSVIADRWVLTAAHCLYDGRGDLMLTSDLKVATNAANLDSEDAKEIVITNYFIHPAYDNKGSNPHSDLALLELATDSNITPVKLSTRVSDELYGLYATVIGWGAVDVSDPNNTYYPMTSHAVSVPIVSLDVCNSPISYANNILANQLCAGAAEGGRDSCVGDSGGPLVVRHQGEYQQVGIVSFGYGCAQPNYYGIYTNIGYFINWINQFVYVGDAEFDGDSALGAGIQRGTVSSYTTSTSSASNSDYDENSGSSSLLGLFLLSSLMLLRRRA